MKLPDFLQKTIEDQVKGISLKELATFSKDLSNRYREVKGFVESHGHRLAYLVSRFPATYAAIYHVLHQCAQFDVKSLADVGAGPGTGAWAAREAFDKIEKVDLYERDREFIRIGKAMGVRGNWKQIDLKDNFSMDQADLVLMSYAIGELSSSHWPNLIKKLWENTKKLLVIVEPGTPVGFERIKQIRELLLSFGGHMLAPCPHQNACPMSIGDWCHFAARIERSSLHRQIKEGVLGHEDEKFSYIAIAKQKVDLGHDRILRHPIKKPGHITFALCTDKGICNRTLSKKDKENYSKARKAEWGDTLL